MAHPDEHHVIWPSLSGESTAHINKVVCLIKLTCETVCGDVFLRRFDSFDAALTEAQTKVTELTKALAE